MAAVAVVEPEPTAAPVGDLAPRYQQYSEYLKTIFKPQDVICFVLIEHNKDGDDKKERVAQEFTTLEDALTMETFQNLVRANNEPSVIDGNSESSVYVAMNAYRSDLIGKSVGRTQDNVACVRALQADMDDVNRAASVVSAMQGDGKVPAPTMVIESSTGKRQAIWTVYDFPKDDAKPVMQAIAKEHDTDSAVAEVARVMRVPGFINRKHSYTDKPIAKLLSNTRRRYTRADFRVEVAPKSQFEQRVSPETYLDAPFVRKGGQFGGIYDHVLKIVGHYVGKIKDGDVMFDIVKGCKLRNGCFLSDGVTPYEWNEDQVRQQCHKLVKEWKDKGGAVALVQSAPLTSTPNLEVRDVAEPTANSDNLVLPVDAIMASTVLGQLYQEVFAPNGWCVELALPALATAASTLVPQPSHISRGGGINLQNPFTHLYTALIGPVNIGKSQVDEWAAKSLGIFADTRGAHAINVKFGSAEQMWKYMASHKSDFKGTVLVNPDEWAHVMAKAGIPDSSFCSNLTTAYYKRRHAVTLGGQRGGLELEIPFPFSITGGVVEKDFDSVFGATTMGGLYDRFLFGLAPKNFSWVYRPFPVEHPLFHDLIDGTSLGWLKTNPVPVFQDQSVFDVSKEWKKKDPAIGRITEVCIRVATIFASIDGRSTVTGDDLEKLWSLAVYQKAIREQYQPNAGLNPDAIYANTVFKWVNANASNWRTFTDMKNGTNAYREKLGPSVCSRALKGLAHDHAIELWVSTLTEKDGKWTENAMPADYTGKRPKFGSGLVRKVASD